MNILNLKRIIAKILIISIIFTSLSVNTDNCVLAAEISDQARETMSRDLQNWMATASYRIIKSEYNDKGEDKVAYAAELPSLDGGRFPNIEYDKQKGKYTYKITDLDGNTIRIPFDVEPAIATSTDGFSSEVTASNYKKYTDTTQMDTILVTEDLQLIKLLELEDDTPRQMTYVVEMEGGIVIVSENEAENFEIYEGSFGEKIWNGIKNGFLALWDIAINAIAGIINDLLLWIADGIHDLIDSIFGAEERLTVYKIIFGKIDKLSINFWGTTGSLPSENTDEENPSGIVDNAPVNSLKNIVSYWYGVIRGIVISIYLVMLLYIGIKILLASTGSSAQKYKSMLTSWLVGIIIVCFFPYAMQYTVIINDMFVSMIDSSTSNVSEDDSEDSMYQIRMQAEQQKNLTLTIVYIIMLGQLIVLLGVYYKRVFMMAFLITIFPIVAGLYVWEAVNKGKGKALGAWVREYLVLVFVQTFHAVVYVILIDGAYAAFKNGGDWFIFLISVLFLFEAEKIIRAIFGVNSSAKTIGDLASAGAAVWATSRAVGGIFKSNDASKSKDKGDKEEADEVVADARRNTAINNAMSVTSHSSSTARTISNGSESTTTNRTPSALSSTGLPDDENPMANLEAAKAVVAQEALKERTKKGVLKSALNATTGGLARATGITLGLTSGLASGSVKQGLSNAVIANEIAGTGAKLVNGITGYTIDRFAGRRLKRKIKSGKLNQKFKEVGFDLEGKFDEDAEISKAKARIIQEALAAQGAAMRRAGKEKGELKFIKSVEKGRRKENL